MKLGGFFCRHPASHRFGNLFERRLCLIRPKVGNPILSGIFYFVSSVMLRENVPASLLIAESVDRAKP